MKSLSASNAQEQLEEDDGDDQDDDNDTDASECFHQTLMKTINITCETFQTYFLFFYFRKNCIK